MKKERRYLLFISFHSGEHTNFILDGEQKLYDTIEEGITEKDNMNKDEIFEAVSSIIKCGQKIENAHENIFYEFPSSTWMTITYVGDVEVKKEEK